MAEGARDAGKKVDQPSEQAGKGPDPKVAEEAAETKAKAKAPAKGKAAKAETEDKPKPKKKPAAKKAEGTAAAKTKVDKEAAEAGTTEDAPKAKSKAKAEPKAKSETKAKAEAKDEPKAKPAAKKPAAKKAEKAEDKPAAATRSSRRARGADAERVTVRAHAKYVRTSARKARLVADHVRGKDVAEARALLAFSPRSVAEDWRKLLESAIANAEHNHDLVGDNLRVLNATADEGPTLKRFRPRAMGRATRIRKRTSHLSITLTPKETR